ncbi:MAG: histidine kinase, partial [Bacilli bacterium]|nr:histidine kinase [Bacilli bacterium]
GKLIKHAIALGLIFILPLAVEHILFFEPLAVSDYSRRLAVGFGNGLTYMCLFFTAILFLLTYPDDKEARRLFGLQISCAASFFLSRDTLIVINSFGANLPRDFFDFFGYVAIFASLGYMELGPLQRKFPLISIVSFALSVLAVTFLPGYWAWFSSLPAFGTLFYFNWKIFPLKGEFFGVKAFLSGINGLLFLYIIDDVMGFGDGCYGVYSLMMVVPSALVFYRIVTQQSATLEISKKSREAMEKCERLKYDALARQSGPHFIFNSLTYVQGQYHMGLEEGRTAMRLLSSNFAAFLKTGRKELVTLDEEIAFIRGYAKITGLRKGKTVPVFVDNQISTPIYV